MPHTYDPIKAARQGTPVVEAAKHSWYLQDNRRQAEAKRVEQLAELIYSDSAQSRHAIVHEAFSDYGAIVEELAADYREPCERVAKALNLAMDRYDDPDRCDQES